MTTVEQRIVNLGLLIPEASAPAANYVPFCISGNTVYVSGQLPIKDGKIAYTGTVGDGISEEEATEAAKLCSINIIAQLKLAAQGDLDRISRIVRLGGFVNCIAGFGGQPKIINGASNLIADVFEEAGKHSRAAVGVNALPFNATVEIDCIAELTEEV